MRDRALWRVRLYLRPYRGRIALIALASIVSIAAQLAIPLVAKAVIDGPIHDRSRAGLWPLGGLAFALGIVELVLNHRRRVALAEVALGLETRLRDDLYAHLQRLDVGFHDRWQSGQLLSRATGDIAVIRRFAGFGAIFFVVIGVQVICIFTLLLRLNVALALLTIAAAVPVLVLCHRFTVAYHQIVRRIQDQTGDLTTTIEESAKGLPVIKAFGRADAVFAGYDNQSCHIHHTQMGRIRLHTKFIWVLGVIPNLTLTVVLLAGALTVASGRLSIGGLVAFVTYVLMLVWPIEALGWIMAMAEEAETAAGRVWEVFDAEPDIVDRPGARQLERAVGEVRFDGVSFRYQGSKRTVLRGLDLVIHPGETMALVGATGSGKTTVATLLARLYDPSAGRVTLDGHDLRDITVNSLRSQIGVAFEDATLFSASALENLLIGNPDATEDEVMWALEVAQAGFVHDLPWGLDTRIGEQGLSLSGGQRQRLALARAIIGRPRVLILDDPLSALDVHTEALVEEGLRPLLAECTALIVVHRPSTIALANRTALLDGGRVVAVGTHHDLMLREPRYRAILSQESDVEDRSIA